MLRIGGGWESLENYLEKHHEQMREKMLQLLETQKAPLEKVVYDLLVKYGAEQDVIK